MNESTKRYLLIVGLPIVILAVFLAAWFGYGWWQKQNTYVPEPFAFTVVAEAQPSLEREIVVPEGFPRDAETIVRRQIGALREKLSENPADYISWLDLAIQYKVIEDYEGAREIWEYMKIAAPMEAVSYHNLGNLYDLYLKDYEQAEMNYTLAIERSRENVQGYMGLHELYRYSYKTDTSAAADILKEGIRAVTPPADIDLMIMLAGYYKEEGDTANALQYYRDALRRASALNNPALVQQLDNEIDRLEQR